MEIKGKVHCLFEQSGTFKNEFIKLGIPAEDYDIQNNFGETDHVVDLFADIEEAYKRERERETVFDRMTQDDLIIAFYPCIFFCATSQMAFYLGYVNYRCLSDVEAIEKIIQRAADRKEFFVRLIKLCAICLKKGLRMVLENPWSEQTYLKANFLKAPDVVDMDRTERGDVFKKPTAYWFWNCKPTNGETWQKNNDTRTIMSSKGGVRAGLCSEERSMISPDYARNFICDFILGKVQKGSALQFDFGEAQ